MGIPENRCNGWVTHADFVGPVIHALRQDGVSWVSVCRYLERNNWPTPQKYADGDTSPPLWHHTQAQRVYQRFQETLSREF